MIVIAFSQKGKNRTEKLMEVSIHIMMIPTMLRGQSQSDQKDLRDDTQVIVAGTGELVMKTFMK